MGARWRHPWRQRSCADPSAPAGQLPALARRRSQRQEQEGRGSAGRWPAISEGRVAGQRPALPEPAFRILTGALLRCPRSQETVRRGRGPLDRAVGAKDGAIEHHGGAFACPGQDTQKPLHGARWRHPWRQRPCPAAPAPSHTDQQKRRQANQPPAPSSTQLNQSLHAPSTCSPHACCIRCCSRASVSAPWCLPLHVFNCPARRSKRWRVRWW